MEGKRKERREGKGGRMGSGKEREGKCERREGRGGGVGSRKGGMGSGRGGGGEEKVERKGRTERGREGEKGIAIRVDSTSTPMQRWAEFTHQSHPSLSQWRGCISQSHSSEHGSVQM